MIGWLKGNVLLKQPPDLLIEVNGVGYELLAPLPTFYQLPEEGKVSLFVHMVVREDAHQLYGFAAVAERFLFRQLIKINGVGPKLALAILSSIELQDFLDTVQREDVQRLVKIPGIGKKTAERLLIEIKDKVKPLAEQCDLAIGSELAEPQLTEGIVSQEAESALVALGYKPQDAMKMIKSVSSDQVQSAEELIRMALKRVVS